MPARHRAPVSKPLTAARGREGEGDQDRRARRPAWLTRALATGLARASHECSAGIRCRSGRVGRVAPHRAPAVQRPNVADCRVVPINGRAGFPRHDAGWWTCASPGYRADGRCPSVAARSCSLSSSPRSRRKRAAPDTVVLDPVVVTASRSPQRLLELVADVTVIDAGRDRAQRRAGHRRRCCSGSLASRSSRTADPAHVGRLSARRECGANAGADRRHARRVRVDAARRRWRRFPSTRSTASRSCAVPHRACMAPMRSAASSRCSRAAGHGGCACERIVGYGTFDTLAASAGASGGGGRAGAGGRADRRRGAATASTRSSIRPISATTRTATDIATGASARTASCDYADGQALSVQYFRSHLDSQFDGGDNFDDRTVTTLSTWQVAATNRLGPSWRSRLSAGEGDDRSVSLTGFGAFPFVTHQRQYAWQNDVALPGRRADARTRAPRGARRHGCRVSPSTRATRTPSPASTGSLPAAHAIQANLRHDDSSQFGGRTTGALAWGYRMTPVWRVTASAGTAFKVPTFNDLYFPGFSNPDLRPETSRNIEAGLHALTRTGDVTWQAHALAYRNRVRDLIVFQCDANFDCRPEQCRRRDARRAYAVRRRAMAGHRPARVDRRPIAHR